MSWMVKGVRSVCSMPRLCLLSTLLIDTLVASMGASSPVWKQVNLTTSIDHQWPLSRLGAAVWHDPSLESVWMFGGQRALNETTVLDDFWKLDLTTSKWTEIQRQKIQWPSGRKLAVACGGPNGILLAGGIVVDGTQRCDVWQYDFTSSNWRITSRQEEVLGNTTRFWSNGTELFGLTMHSSSAVFMLRYNLTEQSWGKFAVHNEPRNSNPRLAPDLKNLTHYPLWPSGDDFVIIYAPIKNYTILIDVKENETQQPCILWKLSKSLQWKPFVNDCELYKTCPSILPSNLRTAEAIRGLPPCRAHSATWTDDEGNLWMYGRLSREGKGLQGMWRFSRKTKSWLQMSTSCTDNHSPPDCQDSPGYVTDAMTWRVNSTLFLLSGHPTSDPNNPTFLKQLWTLDLSDFSDHFTLPVPPFGIFLISLSGLVILSLFTCGVIIFAKCSSPLAPRIKPPVRTYGKVQYSPVSSTDVLP